VVYTYAIEKLPENIAERTQILMLRKLENS
jgi:hypothetical protein